jgi:hypothetical protein
MARNQRHGGGRRGAIRNRTQFPLPNGHYAKVNRATGHMLSVKADRKPYKGVVIAPAPERLPRRAGPRPVLPALIPRSGWRVRQPAPLAPDIRLVVLPDQGPLAEDTPRCA